MANVKERIDSFYKGMSEDPRSQDLKSFFLSFNFDTFSNENKLTPMRNTEDDSTNSAGTKANCSIRKFLFGTGGFYGLGRISAASPLVKIYQKTGGSIAGTWQASSNGEASSKGVNYEMFLQYKTFLYMFAASRYIAAFDTGGGAFNETAVDLTSATYRSQGLVTSDDLLLVPYDNKIAVKDGGTTATDNWETARLTLPSIYTIVDLEEFGSLVAITCKSTSANQNTGKVFLWDKVSPDVTEVIEMGDGMPILSANLGGELITVLVTPDGSASFALLNNFVVRKYIGGRSSEVLFAIPTETYISGAIGVSLTNKVRDNSGVSFGCDFKLDGVNRINIIKLGKLKAGFPLALSVLTNPNNDTQPTSLEGMYKIGDYYWFAMNADGSVVRTNDNNLYTALATIITQKINGENRYKGISMRDKQLKMAGITCPPLPTGATITLSYRVNATTSWTKIFDYTTANGMVRQAGVDAAGDDFLNFKEIQFKVEIDGSTNTTPGELLSIDFEYEILGADIDD